MLDILPRGTFSILWSLLILGCRSALLNHPLNNISGDIYFKVNNESNRTLFEICSKLTLKTPEQEQRRHSGAEFTHYSGFAWNVTKITFSPAPWRSIASSHFCYKFTQTKVCVHYFLSRSYFSINDSSSKTTKNVFYFI